MKNIKHVGKIKNTGSKVLVAFRTLPGESNMCLVIPTDPLPDRYHDAIMELVETDFAQESYEFGEALFIKYFPDGRPMLPALSQDGRMQKVPTENVIMSPTPNNEIKLSDLNILIAEQKNCAVDDLCTFVKGFPTEQPKDEITEVAEAPIKKTNNKNTAVLKAEDNAVLSDKDLARSYRSQADAMYKEAAKLRKQADELDPPTKKTVKKESV